MARISADSIIEHLSVYTPELKEIWGQILCVSFLYSKHIANHQWICTEFLKNDLIKEPLALSKAPNE